MEGTYRRDHGVAHVLHLGEGPADGAGGELAELCGLLLKLLGVHVTLVPAGLGPELRHLPARHGDGFSSSSRS